MADRADRPKDDGQNKHKLASNVMHFFCFFTFFFLIYQRDQTKCPPSCKKEKKEKIERERNMELD